MKINKEKLKILGEGVEKIVYEDSNNPELAIGVFKEYKNHGSESAELVRARFYMTKILHLLFPKNIPDMHLAASDPRVIVVDKVEDGNKVFSSTGEESEESYRALEELRSKIESVGVLEFDSNWPNFKFNKGGDLSYLDSFSPWEIDGAGVRQPYIRPLFDIGKLESALQNLDEEKRDLGLSYLKRVEVLYKKALDDFKRLESKK